MLGCEDILVSVLIWVSANVCLTFLFSRYHVKSCSCEQQQRGGEFVAKEPELCTRGSRQPESSLIFCLRRTSHMSRLPGDHEKMGHLHVRHCS